MKEIASEIKNLVNNYTIETTPKVYSKIDNLKQLLSPNTWVYIIYLPDEDQKKIINTFLRI